jgi:hypothetical protein
MILERRYSKKSHSYFARLVVPILDIIFSVLLMMQVTQQQIIVSLILFAIGVVWLLLSINPVSITLNDTSKILSFVTAITLFLKIDKGV